MYTIVWSEFFSMDRGGSQSSYIRIHGINNAKQKALSISQRPMVPGVVTINDSNGKKIATYQLGKKQS